MMKKKRPHLLNYDKALKVEFTMYRSIANGLGRNNTQSITIVRFTTSTTHNKHGGLLEISVEVAMQI